MTKKNKNVPDVTWCRDLELRSKIAKAKLSYENDPKQSHLDEYLNIVNEWWNDEDDGQIGWESQHYNQKKLKQKLKSGR
jgi:hypothetical protein